MNPARTVRNFLDMSARVREETGKSRWTQLAEIVDARLGPGKLGLIEYYDYHVWRQRERQARRAFVGYRRVWKLQEALSSPRWWGEANDKQTYYSLCKAWGIPHPEVRAIFVERNTRHGGGGIATLCTLDEVRAFLASPAARLPLFIKPFRSQTGIGGAGVAGYDATSDRVTLINGDTARVEDVVQPDAAKHRYWPAGCVLQEVMRPHPEIARRTGGRLCTVRVLVLIERDGPRVLQAALRVAQGSNMVDNMRHGETGNSAGPVDVATGMVQRQLVDPGFREREVRTHPDTGEDIVGFVLPDWEAAMELCRRASLCFGGFRALGWDVALSDRGPLLVELNAPFDMDAAQLMSKTGFRDAAVDRVLEEIGSTR
jgi:hypothetical protein